MLSKTSSALWAIERRALSLRTRFLPMPSLAATQTYAMLEALNVALQRQILRAAWITIQRRREVIEGSSVVRSSLIERSPNPVDPSTQARSISWLLHDFDVAMGFDRLGGLVEHGEPTRIDKAWDKLPEEPSIDWREYRVCIESGDFDGAVRWCFAHQGAIHAWNEYQLLRVDATLHAVGVDHFPGYPERGERVWYMPDDALFAQGAWQLDAVRVKASRWIRAELRKLADAQSRAEGHDPAATREEWGFSLADMMEAPISVRMHSHSLRNEVWTTYDLADSIAMHERYDDTAWHLKRDDAPAVIAEYGREVDFKVGPRPENVIGVIEPWSVNGPDVEDAEMLDRRVMRGRAKPEPAIGTNPADVVGFEPDDTVDAGAPVIVYADRALAARQDRLYAEAYEDVTIAAQPQIDVTILDPAEHEARTQWALSALGQRPYVVEHLEDGTLQAENLRRAIERIRREALAVDLTID